MTTAIDNSATSLRWRLREATRLHHAKVEQYVTLHETGVSRSQYVMLLKALWGFYHPLEAALSQLDWPRDVAFATRCKSSWLFEDLIALGHARPEIQRLPQCSRMPTFNSAVSGLGVLYVLEGATLGGQVIARRVGPALGINDSEGLRFFSSYGAAVGNMWRSYVAVLEEAGRCPNASAEIECTAIDTFVCFQSWFETVRQLERSSRHERGSNTESVA